MRLSCKVPMLVMAASLAICLGALPLVGCSSGSAPADDAAPAEEEVVEEKAEPEEEAQAEAEPEEEAVDESVWVRTSETYTYVSSTDDSENYSYSIAYELDDAGNRVKETSLEDGEEYVYYYNNDEYGWMLTVREDNESEADMPKVTNEYDETGRLIHASSDESERTYTYDAEGNCIQRDYYSTAYQLDEEGNRVEGSEHQIHTVVNYSADGFITSRLSDWGLPQLYEMAYEYGDDGRPTSCVVTMYSLDEDGNKTDEGRVNSTITFTYDENGNVVKTESAGDFGTSTYEYEYKLIEHPSVAATVESHLVSF